MSGKSSNVLEFHFQNSVATVYYIHFLLSLMECWSAFSFLFCRWQGVYQRVSWGKMDYLPILYSQHEIQVNSRLGAAATSSYHQHQQQQLMTATKEQMEFISIGLAPQLQKPCWKWFITSRDKWQKFKSTIDLTSSSDNRQQQHRSIWN